MRTKSLLIASLLCGFMSANAQTDNVATATYGNAAGNTTRTMTVALNRSTDYVAFYLDMTLPAGTTVKEAVIKAPLKNGGTVDLSAKGGTATESTDFKVPFNQSGTNCKLVGYNYGNKKIGGTSGEILLTLTLETATGVAYNAEGVNATCTFVEDGAFNEVVMATTTTEARLWGDVVKDGTVDGYDIQAVANLFAGKSITAPTGKTLDKFAGDPDQNDKYDGYDIQRVANIFAGK